MAFWPLKPLLTTSYKPAARSRGPWVIRRSVVIPRTCSLRAANRSSLSFTSELTFAIDWSKSPATFMAAAPTASSGSVTPWVRRVPVPRAHSPNRS